MLPACAGVRQCPRGLGALGAPRRLEYPRMSTCRVPPPRLGMVETHACGHMLQKAIERPFGDQAGAPERAGPIGKRTSMRR
jgi:hypothetical protein